MKKLFSILICLILVLVFNNAIFAQATGGADNYYNTKIYTAMGGDSVIVTDGGMIIIRTGGQIVGGVKLAITADTFFVKSGGYFIIQSGGALNAADKITTTDTIQVATNAVIYIATGGRIISDGLVDADTINADSTRNKTMRVDTVWVDKVAKVDSVNVATSKTDTAWITQANVTNDNVDSLRSVHANIDTTRINKVLATVSGNVIAGTVSFSANDSVHTYVKGMTVNDIVFAGIKAVAGVKPDSSISVWAIPSVDTLRINASRAITKTIYWFRILVQ